MSGTSAAGAGGGGPTTALIRGPDIVPGVPELGELAARITLELRTAADPARAARMQAYMKSAMPYLGVPVPQVRALTRAAVRAGPAPSHNALLDAATQLWDRAAHREQRYAAQALTALPPVRGDLSLLPMLEHMIVTGAWWDHVDEAAHRIGELLAAHPGVVRPRMLDWSTADDRWLRRVSIICQLDFRESTDRDLLTRAILATAGERDFFLRKAIGWALRQYARTDPLWVRAFLAAHSTELSPLSIREAAKHLH